MLRLPEITYDCRQGRCDELIVERRDELRQHQEGKGHPPAIRPGITPLRSSLCEQVVSGHLDGPLLDDRNRSSPAAPPCSVDSDPQRIRADRSECRFGFFIATSFVMVLQRPLESAASTSIYSSTKFRFADEHNPQRNGRPEKGHP
jgi:hypothetical protein